MKTDQPLHSKASLERTPCSAERPPGGSRAQGTAWVFDRLSFGYGTDDDEGRLLFLDWVTEGAPEALEITQT